MASLKTLAVRIWYCDYAPEELSSFCWLKDLHAKRSRDWIEFRVSGASEQRSRRITWLRNIKYFHCHQVYAYEQCFEIH